MAGDRPRWDLRQKITGMMRFVSQSVSGRRHPTLPCGCGAPLFELGMPRLVCVACEAAPQPSVWWCIWCGGERARPIGGCETCGRHGSTSRKDTALRLAGLGDPPDSREQLDP